jgi:hypothetical protein
MDLGGCRPGRRVFKRPSSSGVRKKTSGFSRKKYIAKLRKSILKSWKMMTDKIPQSGNCSFKAWDLSEKLDWTHPPTIHQSSLNLTKLHFP